MQPMFKTPEERAFIRKCSVSIEKNVHQGEKKIKEIIFVQSNYFDQFSSERFVINFL